MTPTSGAILLGLLFCSGVTWAQEKAGRCPVPSTMCSLPLPKPKCDTDQICPGDQKCCTPFCGKECTKPVLDYSSDKSEKSGLCPISKARCQFPLPKPKCDNDQDCLGEMKCCVPVCGKDCTDPIFVQ
ncbi:antileukoproteinase-like [Discoglossus pictus]